MHGDAAVYGHIMRAGPSYFSLQGAPEQRYSRDFASIKHAGQQQYCSFSAQLGRRVASGCAMRCSPSRCRGLLGASFPPAFQLLLVIQMHRPLAICYTDERFDRGRARSAMRRFWQRPMIRRDRRCRHHDDAWPRARATWPSRSCLRRKCRSSARSRRRFRPRRIRHQQRMAGQRSWSFREHDRRGFFARGAAGRLLGEGMASSPQNSATEIFGHDAAECLSGHDATSSWLARLPLDCSGRTMPFAASPAA